MPLSGNTEHEPLAPFAGELQPLYDGLGTMTHAALGDSLMALLRQVGELPAPRQTAPYGLFKRQLKQATAGLGAFDATPGWREFTPTAYQYNAQPLWQYATALAGLGVNLGDLDQAVVTDAKPGARREWEPERHGLLDWAETVHVEWNRAARIDSSFYAAQLFADAARQLLYPEMIRQLWAFWLGPASPDLNVFGAIYKDFSASERTFSTELFHFIRDGVNQDAIAINSWPGVVWIWQEQAAIALHGLISVYANRPQSVLYRHNVETALSKLHDDHVLDIRHGKLTKRKDDGTATVLDLVLIPATHIWPATEIPKECAWGDFNLDLEMA